MLFRCQHRHSYCVVARKGRLGEADGAAEALFHACADDPARHDAAGAQNRDARQLVKAAGAFLYWKLRPSQASRAKSATLSFLKGRSADEMLDVARAFFRDEYLPRFYQDGLTELWSLRSQGMKLVVVSASPDVYMRALPEFMPIDAVLSTRCEVGGDGRYTGQVGENCKGEEKVRRIEQYLKENGFVLDMKCSSAYGDSPSDADMMALVNRAVLVNPKKALLRRRPDGIVVHWT